MYAARRAAWFTIALCLGLFPGQSAWSLGDLPASSATDLDSRIARLITQLGADDFSLRERAQTEIERIGLPAFDALDAARQSDDIEVALRARYLLRVMSVDWSQDDDPPEIKSVLKAYGEQSEAERKTRMERLSHYGTPPAVLALCRLARYETHPILAKEAALLVMNAERPEDATVQANLLATIRKTMGTSRRTTADWLRWFARTIEAPNEAVDGWQIRVNAELATLRKGQNTTSGDVVRSLLRWQCGYLRRLDRHPDAQQVAQRVVEFTEATESQLSELVTWLVELEYWPVVDRVAEQYAKDFDRSSPLLYRAAEAQLKQGRKEQADAIAQRALQLNESPAEHFEIGVELKERGLFAWAEQELRQTMKLDPGADIFDMRARLRLSEMLYDLQRPFDAAKVWQDLIDDATKSEQLRLRFGEERQLFRARMHFFYAQHHVERKEWDEARRQLEQAVRHDPRDADVLIAMYRIPDPSADFRRVTLAHVTDAANYFQEQVHKGEQEANRAILPDQREDINETLANSCNQFAWLVANTEGDLDEAVRLSHRSIELMPKTASYLDTLGHCYFAKKDYANAVKYQAIAAKREPHTMQIQRQLRVFQKALAESRSGG